MGTFAWGALIVYALVLALISVRRTEYFDGMVFIVCAIGLILIAFDLGALK